MSIHDDSGMASIDVSLVDVPYNNSEMRHRRAPSPIPNYSYETKPEGSMAYYLRLVKEMIIPEHLQKQENGMEWKPKRTKSIACVVMEFCGAALVLVALGLFVLFMGDLANSDYDMTATQTAEMLRMFDGRGREGKIIPTLYMNSSGITLRNVLNPQHAIENADDVRSLFRKMRRYDLKAKDLSGEFLSRGYITYLHERVGDNDADFLSVNATLDAIEELIRSERQEETVCESYMQYGLEYNAIMLYLPEPTMLYNPRIDAFADDMHAEAEHVRSRILLVTEQEEEAKIANIPHYITVEYLTREVLRKRMKLTEKKKIACVIHSLRLAGVNQ